MIIVDARTIASLLLPDERATLAQSAYSRDPAWASTPLWRTEFRHILIGYLEKKLVSIERAEQIIELAETRMQPRQYQVVSRHVIDIVMESGLSAGQAEYVALARELNLTLVSVDSTIIQAYPDTALHLSDFAEGRQLDV